MSVTTDKASVLRMLGHVVTGAAVELQLIAYLIYYFHLHARHVLLLPKCIILIELISHLTCIYWT